MGKSRRRRFDGLDHFTQDNGRERGLPEMGDGPAQETSPMGHATFTKSNEEMRRRQARREKMRRYSDDD